MFRNDKYNAMFENLNNIIIANNAMFNHIQNIKDDHKKSVKNINVSNTSGGDKSKQSDSRSIYKKGTQ